jgi:hypothetical protein
MTVEKSARGCLRMRGSRTIWGKVRWFNPTQPKASGYQLHHRVLMKLCGRLRAVRTDRAVLERLGAIIEMGQRVVKGDYALTRRQHPVGSAYDL